VSAGWLFLPLFITGRSASPVDELPVPDPLLALSLLESFLWSTGPPESDALEPVLGAELAVFGLELAVLAPELALLLSVLSLGDFLCSTGRSGSLGSVWALALESPPPPESLLELPLLPLPEGASSA
jgi:hypothetical protein